MSDKVKTILEERPSKHGEFAENSRATWEIMRTLQHERNWPTLSDQQRHSLYMIAHKMARIVAGDPAEPDHWDDISGYATCVADRLRKPVVPYDGHDVYSALAVAWNIPREDAKAQVQAIMAKQIRSKAVSEGQRTMQQEIAGAPAAGAEAGRSAEPSKLSQRLPRSSQGSPEDGGQHASADALAAELEADIEAALNR
jgi:hypothetical protein